MMIWKGSGFVEIVAVVAFFAAAFVVFSIVGLM
jgi:hypothetical protein